MPTPAALPATMPSSPTAIVQTIDARTVESREFLEPGAVWRDQRGLPIQAHGGGITRIGDTFYWFGEDHAPPTQKNHRCVGCYSSKDLLHWTFCNQAVDMAAPPGVEPSENWVLERPKVYFNAKTKKFVMYAHIDNGRYALASVAVFTSDTIDGDYQFLRLFRPFGKESRDIGQFVDDDGSAYLIFESRPTHGFYIAQLSDDYLDVRETCFVKAPLEGGALVHYDGRYYFIGSHMSGWAPNPDVYSTAKALTGPWSEFKDIAPPAANTYNSQSTFLLRIVGSEKTQVIFMADQWRPRNLADSRYLWMPLEIDGEQLKLPPPRPWKVDLGTGEIDFR